MFIKKKLFKFIFITLSLIILLVLGLYLFSYYKINNSHGWERGRRFMEAYSSHTDFYLWNLKNHGEETALKPDTDNSFFNGSVLMYYDSTNKNIRVSIFNLDGIKPNATDLEKNNFQKVFEAVNDPKIGGMFDKAGGIFTHSNDWKNLYLTNTYNIENMSVTEFISKVDNQQKLNDAWLKYWDKAVAQIVHSGQPAPTTPVTLENNPYK